MEVANAQLRKMAELAENATLDLFQVITPEGQGNHCQLGADSPLGGVTVFVSLSNNDASWPMVTHIMPGELRITA